MNRDMQLYLLADGQGSMWDLLSALPVLVCSSTARGRYRRLKAVSQVLAYSMTDPDDVLTIRTNRRRPAIQRSSGIVLLLALLLVASLEWGFYTMPAMHDWVQVMGHKCGLLPK